jgi:D-3-phosphoglycerate dehydrogenase
LENISEEAVAAFITQGFHVDHHKTAWSEDELVANIGSYHAIGIRSKTKITDRVIKSAAKVPFIIIGRLSVTY